MSRGPGRLQAAILACMQERGGWCWVYDLCTDVYKRIHQPPTEEFTISYSFYTSLRRALRSLKARGAVLLAEGRDTYCRRRDDPYNRLLCWLPGQTPPANKLIKTVPGESIEGMVRRAIETATPEEITNMRRYGPQSARWPSMPAEFTPYALVVAKVQKELNCNYGWTYTAINRAVMRMTRRGELEARYFRGNAYGCVRIIGVSVAV